MKKIIFFLLIATYAHITIPIFDPIESVNLKQQNSISDAATTNEFKTESFDYLFEKGNQCFINKNYNEAITYYKKAALIHPNCSHTCFNLGQAFFYNNDYQNALNEYKKTVKLQPNHSQAYAQIGELFFQVRQYKDAIFPLKKSLAIDNKNTEVRLILVRVYNQIQLYDKALKTIEKGMKLDPDNVNLIFEKANTYNHINKLDQALQIYLDLNEKFQNNESILYNIAFTLKKLGKVTESLEYYEKVLKLNPQHSDAQFSHGLAQLVLGNFDEGWKGYEWRYHKPGQGSLRSFTEPRWDGQDLNGKTILIHSEQGLGDTLEFIRYAQTIKEKKGSIIAAVQKPLITLLQRCPYLDKVVCINDEILPHFDVQAPIMSLPFILKTTVDTIPNSIPYISADPLLVQEWKQKLSEDKNFKIGICWQGNDNYATPTLRTAVALKSIQAEQFSIIAKIPGVSLYSLQKMSGEDQLKNLPEGMKIITFDENFDQKHGRFMDTAAVMQGALDLVITVDTSISHLSGALGIPTWIMLPNPADWRWMIDRNDSPWYPTVRLFKQPKPGDWDSVLKEVAAELEKLLAKSSN